MSTGVGAQPGNQNARKAKIWADAVRRAIARKASGNLQHGLDGLADKLIEAATAGEQWALIELGNRLDGKPPQAIIGGDEDDPPVKFQKIERVIVRGDAADRDG